MNHTSYDPNTGLASIGPGSRWLDVYQTLDPHGVGVTGGRLGSVGAGGLLTGGGCSLYMFRDGFACDSVVAHEVVLADGSIVKASSEESPDLHRALKGGVNNFGIVTKFYLRTFPTSPIWQASLTHPEDQASGHIAAFKRWIDNVVDYQSSSAILFWTYIPADDRISVLTSLSDVSGAEEPPIFRELLDLPGATEKSARKANMSTLAQLAQADGYR